MKTIIRKALRKGVRKLKTFVREESPPRPPDFSKDRTIYPRIAWMMDQAVRASRLHRPSYLWSTLQAGHLAKSLGVPRISVIEFGVAGGNGLVALEAAAVLVQENMGVEVDVCGFDTGVGLPRPKDNRDLPNLYAEGAYRMDVDTLKTRLRKAKLILGDVDDTLRDFERANPAPIGFMSIDVDYYTSTLSVLKALDFRLELLMPRIHCYFDDILCMTFSEFTGERLAISEFNSKHPERKLSPIFGLKYWLSEPYSNQPWCEQMFLAHLFDHPLYGHDDGLMVDRSGARNALFGS